MDLPAVDFENLPRNQHRVRTAHGAGSEIHPQQDDSLFLVDDRFAIFDARQGGDTLGFDVLAARQEGAARPSPSAWLGTSVVSISLIF